MTSDMKTIGLLHPGEMGSSVGAAARRCGHRVLWCSQGRSTATRERAERDGFEEVDELTSLVTHSDLILSICPPAAAYEVAREVAGLDFDGLYLDANAVSPATARRIGEEIRGGGASFVDGGLIGPPARAGASTTLYLSGEDADALEGLFTDSPLATEVVGDEAGRASAVKIAFASWSKGSAALLLATCALAEAEGATEGLRHAWAKLSPGLAERAEATAAGTSTKAWRFSGEMREIAASFAAAGLPHDFHRGAAVIYDTMADFKARGATLAEVIAALLVRRA